MVECGSVYKLPSICDDFAALKAARKTSSRSFSPSRQLVYSSIAASLLQQSSSKVAVKKGAGGGGLAALLKLKRCLVCAAQTCQNTARTWRPSFLLCSLPNQTSEFEMNIREQSTLTNGNLCYKLLPFLLWWFISSHNDFSTHLSGGLMVVVVVRYTSAAPLCCGLMWERSWGELRLCHEGSHGRSHCSLYRGGCPTSESVLITAARNRRAYSEHIQHRIHVLLGCALWMYRFSLNTCSFLFYFYSKHPSSFATFTALAS